MTSPTTIAQIAAAIVALKDLSKITRPVGLLAVPEPIIGDAPLAALAKSIIARIGIDLLLEDKSGLVSDTDMRRLGEVMEDLPGGTIHRVVEVAGIIAATASAAEPVWRPVADAFGTTTPLHIDTPEVARAALLYHFLDAGSPLAAYSIEAQVETHYWRTAWADADRG